MAKKEAAEQKDLSATLADLEKKFGLGAVRRLGDSSIVRVPVISTGLLSLDRTIGPGGIPRGRTVELYGPESSGKTTLALQILAESQKLGPCAYIDAEHAIDPVYAQHLGVNVDELLFSQPDYGEQALEICNSLIKTGEVVCIIIDSVAALTPRAELEGEVGDTTVGAQARMMGQALRMITGRANKSQTTVVFINQIREKVGVLYGSPETVPGGRALKFFASLRLDVRRRDQIKDGGDPIGANTEIKIPKNKVGRPFVSTSVKMFFGDGFSKEMDLLSQAVDLGVVQVSGSHHTYQGEMLGQGVAKAAQFLRDNPVSYDAIMRDCRNELWGGTAEYEATDEPVDEDIPESLDDLPDEEAVPEEERVSATAEYETNASASSNGHVDEADATQYVGIDEFAIRDWFAERAGKLIAAGTAARELHMDPALVLQVCRKLAAAGGLDDAGKPDGKMFASK